MTVTNYQREEANIFNIFFVILMLLVLPSPLFNIFNITYSYWLALQILYLPILLVFLNRGLKINHVYSISLLLIFSLVVFFYWGDDIKIALIPVFFIVSLLIAQSLSKLEYDRIITISTYILLILICFAWISFFYALMGGRAIFEFTTYSGRLSYLYIGSLAPDLRSPVLEAMNIIRPSGFFDEPGSFSFIMCYIVTMRTLLRKDENVSIIILLFGFVTFSLAHLIFTVFYIFSIFRGRKYILYSIFGIFIFVIIYSYNYEIIDTALMRRLSFDTNSSELVGDNRSASFITMVNEINLSSFIWGIDSGCIPNLENCNIKYPWITNDNPASPLLRMGILLSISYYLVLGLYLFISLSKKKRFYLFGFMLLFLQRPGILQFWYSFLAISPLIIYFNEKRQLKS